MNGNNGIAGEGGGVDDVQPGVFEIIVGTPFPDYLVGSGGSETIYGGGGADLIEGGEGDDQLFGGADGDDLDGGPGTNGAEGGPGADRCQSISSATSCEANPTKAVVPRAAGEVSVGAMAPGTGVPSQLYLVGSTGADTVTATYATGTVSFSLTGASFDGGSAESGCSVSAATATCPIGALDSVVLAGMGGADNLSANGFPQDAGVVVLGGEGADTLNGDEGSEDLLVDGRGADQDTLSALGRDDALLHNGGPDQLLGGDGNDLFLSVSICDGEALNGGEGRDNASWARLKDEEGKEGKKVSRRGSTLGSWAGSVSPATPAAVKKRRTRWSASRTWRAPKPPTASSATPAPTSCSVTGAPTNTSPAPAGTRSWPTPATPIR